MVWRSVFYLREPALHVHLHTISFRRLCSKAAKKRYGVQNRLPPHRLTNRRFDGKRGTTPDFASPHHLVGEAQFRLASLHLLCISSALPSVHNLHTISFRRCKGEQSGMGCIHFFEFKALFCTYGVFQGKETRYGVQVQIRRVLASSKLGARRTQSTMTVGGLSAPDVWNSRYNEWGLLRCRKWFDKVQSD